MLAVVLSNAQQKASPHTSLAKTERFEYLLLKEMYTYIRAKFRKIILKLACEHSVGM